MTRPHLTRSRFLALLAALAAAAGLPAVAQQAPRFPEPGKTIRLIVPFAAGGGVDSAARLLGEQMRKQLDVTVIVENRPGASGILGGRYVESAPADGYTLLFSAATHVLAKQVIAAAPYDPQTDFTPIARMGEAPLMLVIAPQLEARTVKEVLAAAGEKPEAWSAGLPGAGAPAHLATLLFAKQGNVRLAPVVYKGTQPALVDVGGGHIQMLLDSMISLLPMAKAGKVKPIAITAKTRSNLAPQVPTVQESGLPGFHYVSWYGVWGPKGMAADRVNALNATINTAVAELAKSGALATYGIDPVKETPEQFKRYIAADVAQGAELLRSADFKPE